MNHYKKYQTSFNRYPQQLPKCLSRPENYSSLSGTSGTVRGLGGSYGDAALNGNGRVILTERLDRFLAFEEQSGILCVEAGISLTKILDLIVPRGWFLPVTPGTSNVTVGGCIAADVHGKNHLHEGSIGQHVLALELITAGGSHINCSPQIHSELFWATLGGMGLTGMIGTVTLKLKAIESAFLLVEHKKTEDLQETFSYLSQQDPSDENEYAVAWLDSLNLHLGVRGNIICAKHADLNALPTLQQSSPFSIPNLKTYKLPFGLPIKNLLCPALLKNFNKYYYQQLAKKKSTDLLAYRDYFYTLDKILHWPKLYGKRGFLQYQCVIPPETAHFICKKILQTLNTEKHPVYLAVLKRFGRQNPAPLSFAIPGFTLALDIPILNQSLFDCLDRLDAMVLEAGGRVYLAKDARLKPEMFRNMYPRFSEWLAVKKRWDPENKFSSNLSRRLKLNET